MDKKNLLNSVKYDKPNSNYFDLSHDCKLSCNMGVLVPTLAMECVPGDNIKLGCESLLRFAPLVSPVMHRMHVYMHYFFVPNRIIWKNWEQYITGGDPGETPPAFPFIQVAADGSNYTELMDYFGIPLPSQCAGVNEELVSAMPFAAYQTIYNQYYRDQNLQTAGIYDDVNGLEDGNNTTTDFILQIRRRAWGHDYLTAALPFAQKGEPVSLPVGQFQDVPVKVGFNNDGFLRAWNTTGAAPSPGLVAIRDEDSSNPDIPGGILYADTDQLVLEATTINDLRLAMRLQEYLEKSARGGTRYIEHIRVMFGVKSSDARLQRPEYIVGSRSPVVISEVLNTTGVAGQAPQGEMAGHGVSVTEGKMGSYYCEEHGYIIGIMSVIPDSAYQQGIPKHFLKINDRYEFYNPTFAHLGEQPVTNSEVYAFTSEENQNGVFGYQPRFSEYKYMNSRVAGQFRTTLNYWTLGRIFEAGEDPIPLNSEFIECNPSTRIFAVTDPDVHHLYCHVLHRISARRLMPVFGTPTF